MNEFWALVGNTRRVRKNRDYSMAHWWRLYTYLFSLIALWWTGYAIYRGTVGPIALTVVIPFLLLPIFVISIGLISREWSGQTVSWWLTLPYPRAELLLAKLVGAFIHFLRSAGVSAAAFAVVAVAGALLNSAVWTAGALGAAALVAARLYLVTIAISPLAITLGALVAVTRKSRLRPLAPIVLMAAIFPFSLVVSYMTNGFIKTAVDGTAVSLAFPAATINPSLFAAGVSAVLILSAVIFGAASYILAEQTEI